MKANSKKSFYFKRIPQSEYRRVGEKASGEEGGSYLDLNLPDLKITDTVLRHALKERIVEESKRLLSVLLPEETHGKVQKDRYLKEIFVRLGLE